MICKTHRAVQKKTGRLGRWYGSGLIAAGIALSALTAGSASAQDTAGSAQDCGKFLEKTRTVIGLKVGPQACHFKESSFTFEGRDYIRLDVGLDGTVDGWVADEGNYHEYLTNSPDLVFPQAGNTSPRHQGVGTYESAKGAAMIIVYPRDQGEWNQKMWVMVHGRGRSFKSGSLKPWDKYLEPGSPLSNLDKYDLLLVRKGYALVHTFRTSTENVGEIQTKLDDGRTVDWASFNDTVHYIQDFTQVAQNMMKARRGKAPRRTYIFGHSAGARIGHDVNYTPGLNMRANGRPFFDGVLADDPAAGTWLPYQMRDGKDVLFATEGDKKDFVPQLDVVHQMYNNIAPRFDDSPGSVMSPSYLANKRTNAKMILDKGLGDRQRTYEIRGVSHSGGELVFDERERGILPLKFIMDEFFDLLDAWADKGEVPPHSRSDWAPVGELTAENTIRYPAISFPEISCPRGVYYPWPVSTSAMTAFTSFSGNGIEPLDENKQFMDLNRNGVWDYVETMPQAWRRLGLLGSTEPLTRDKYVSCVTRAAELLQQDGFFSPETTSAYVEKAKTQDLKLAAAPGAN